MARREGCGSGFTWQSFAPNVVTGQEWFVRGDLVFQTLSTESEGDYTLSVEGVIRAERILAPGHELTASAIGARLCVAYLGGRWDVPKNRMYDPVIPPLRDIPDWPDVVARMVRPGDDVFRDDVAIFAKPS